MENEWLFCPWLYKAIYARTALSRGRWAGIEAHITPFSEAG